MAAAAAAAAVHLVPAPDRPPVEISSAVYPQYCMMKAREATFQSWPQALSQLFPPQELVMQGFYYAGYADCIRCFYCGVGLKSWAAHDDVMVEHVRWRPSCGYVLNIKGRQFVNDIKTRIQASDVCLNDIKTCIQASDVCLNDIKTRIQREQRGEAVDTDSPGETEGGWRVQEVVQMVRQMGLPPTVVTQAVERLQEPGVTATHANTILCEVMDSFLTSHNHMSDSAAQSQEEAEDPERMAAETAERIQAENEQMRATQTCRICRQARVGLIFLPCGHLLTCVRCGTQSSNCLACGQTIRATANVFLT
ncbi:baculoviral IAP repeat-containing protein 8-like isoform X1 [Babylonia areolata]|uniref:baculoviral IAP repeat-containing protein 8-like isoform X1 n=1 Tax=Babylonia areolata TaxID=304850 RepID=UPI003FD41F47